ncbi:MULTISPECIES: hypothetical protein [Micromonospora]|nr:hypothetical protein [Micromonospora chalcea]MCT2276340.1 hypothetical protein [Micromonospora chalcea]
MSRAEPMDPIRRQRVYRAQRPGRVPTPRQWRRFVKKLLRAAARERTARR